MYYLSILDIHVSATFCIGTKFLLLIYFSAHSDRTVSIVFYSSLEFFIDILSLNCIYGLYNAIYCKNTTRHYCKNFILINKSELILYRLRCMHNKKNVIKIVLFNIFYILQFGKHNYHNEYFSV